MDTNLDTDITLRPTVAKVYLNNLTHNLEEVRKKAKSAKIMAMVKANAYGHGLIECSKHLINQGVDSLGVAFLEEGVSLRKAGIKIPILVTGGILDNQIHHFLDYNLELTVSSIYKLEQIEKMAEEKNITANIHLKIDTGMERIGVHYYSAKEFIEKAVNSKNCNIIGLYSHLACADDISSDLTKTQIERFIKVGNYFNELGVKKPQMHLANSAGVLYHPETHFDVVRPGTMLYGAYPNPSSPKNADLKPVMSLVSKIAYFKVVKKGASVSYGATWQAKEDTRVVTLPIGYGDGYRRDLSGKAKVLINGKRHPIIGRICMDQFMVDIKQDSATSKNEVVLLGQQDSESITADELANYCGTISYEIFTGFNNRIPREFIR